jgi:DNA modification methylase
MKLVAPRKKPATFEIAEGEQFSLWLGNCFDVLPLLPANSVDSVVVDPPYGLEFMGSDWDGHKNFSAAGIEKDAKSAGGFGADSATNENAYAAARVRHGKLWTERPAKEARRAEGHNRPTDGVLPVYSGGYVYQEWTRKWAAEVFRVLKPGGFLLAFGGSRTYHRLGCGIEDAGFEVRDMLEWLYGSGFPKSSNVGRAIDMHLCRETDRKGRHYEVNLPKPEKRLPGDHVCPEFEDADIWRGHGTALKPAHEPICMARKPLGEAVAVSILTRGTGALNIGAGRIHRAKDDIPGWHKSGADGSGGYQGTSTFRTRVMTAEEIQERNAGGRWPANVILSHSPGCKLIGTRDVKSTSRVTRGGNRSLAFGMGRQNDVPCYGGPDGLETMDAWECEDDCPVRILDEQSGRIQSGGFGTQQSSLRNSGFAMGNSAKKPGYSDKGGASRFFYCAKPSKAEKDAGLTEFEEKAWVQWQTANGTSGVASSISEGRNTKRRNTHPTLKPVNLMRYLCRLVTPPGGTVLDHLSGSSSTGVGAISEGFYYIGIEGEREYWEIGRARLVHAENVSKSRRGTLAATNRTQRRAAPRLVSPRR